MATAGTMPWSNPSLAVYRKSVSRNASTKRANGRVAMSSIRSKCSTIENADTALLVASARRPMSRPHFEAWRCPPYPGYSNISGLNSLAGLFFWDLTTLIRLGHEKDQAARGIDSTITVTAMTEHGFITLLIPQHSLQISTRPWIGSWMSQE